MALSPMMQKYVETKEQYKDCILLYRLGDFYEMFFDDAKTASKVLDLTLTGKSCGLEERAPMCGIPYHAVDSYIDKLVRSGYKVAVCDQMEDPRQAKGLVKRAVTRIVTPGTNTSATSLDESRNNFLMCIVYTSNAIGVSYADVSTGVFYVTEFDTRDKLIDEIYKVMPSEIICNDSFMVSGIDLQELKDKYNVMISSVNPEYFDEDRCEKALKDHFHVADLSGLGLDWLTIGITAAGAVMEYLTQTQKISLAHINEIKPYKSSSFMIIDRSTRRNLELCETMREKEKRGSLFWVLDKTKTAMGARLLRTSIEQPLIDINEINRRQDAVAALKDNAMAREELREYLSGVYDLERLISRISYKSASPRDLIALRSSLYMLPQIKNVLQDVGSDNLKSIRENMDTMDDLYDLLEKSIADEPPLSVHEGGIIKKGYNADVDRLSAAGTDGKKWLSDLLEKEREETGIKNLKLKYNKVFGYYLEVTNSFKSMVPDSWMRKQTLVNAERYTTPELKEMEEEILGSRDRLYTLEYDIFSEIRDEIYSNIDRLRKQASMIAEIDMMASLAVAAEKNNYCRPVLSKNGIINIKAGRHPVVEKMMGDGLFIDNDTYLDNDRHRISIITGPNMAGKSTYMRQTALIVLMAQIGSFVPAEKAEIGIVDRIFTRVGANDDLASGKSTFMVEMTEVANILRNATRKSLIILDEIGRGTSTYDGLAIAWAVVEYIADKKGIGAKTLFATHYHELTELEGKLESVNNYCIAVKERGDDIIFLRKIIPGGADKSYGIQVAKLAGVPEKVLKRAKEIVEQLSGDELLEKTRAVASSRYSDEKKSDNHEKPEKEDEIPGQMSLFDGSFIKSDDIMTEIHDLDLSKMTPIDAMNELYKIQQKVNERM